MLEANKALVRRYYTEAMGDLSGIDQVVSATFVDHHFPPGLPPGPEGVRRFFKDIMGSIFADLKIEHEFMIAEGNKVDCHFTVIARHIGEFAGIPPGELSSAVRPSAHSASTTASLRKRGSFTTKAICCNSCGAASRHRLLVRGLC